jgi:hypothetical protein
VGVGFCGDIRKVCFMGRFMFESIYWKLLSVLVPVLWVIVMFTRDKISRDHERNSSLMRRLSENQGVMIEHPEIQQYILKNAQEKEKFFLDPSRINEPDFIKAKNKVYNDLNLFDELLSYIGNKKTSNNIVGKIYSWVFMPNLIDEDIWLSYIKCKLKHPFYSSTLENEKEIFGFYLIKFWEENRKEISKKPIKSLLW